MSHHHHHHDAHDHDHSHPSPMTFDQKLAKILDHWLKHNSDHAGTYADWARQARENGHDAVAELLDDVIRMTEDINEKFEAARRLMASSTQD